MKNIIFLEKIEKYYNLSSEALTMAKNNINKLKKKGAEEIIDMVERYLSDAVHFKEKEDFVNSFAALNYAHGWLDAGARLRYFLVSDNRLFVVDGEE